MAAARVQLFRSSGCWVRFRTCPTGSSVHGAASPTSNYVGNMWTWTTSRDWSTRWVSVPQGHAFAVAGHITRIDDALVVAVSSIEAIARSPVVRTEHIEPITAIQPIR